MAAKKSSPSLLVSGLAMGMGFLQALIDEVVDLGGFDEQIHYLSTERGRQTVKEIAALIVRSEWKIPRSLMEQLAEHYSREEYPGNPEFWTRDRRWGWWPSSVGVPSLIFGDIEQGSNLPIPPEILEQILNKPLQYPALINYEGDQYIICHVHTRLADTGQPLFVGTEDEEITIAKAKYFDLTR